MKKKNIIWLGCTVLLLVTIAIILIVMAEPKLDTTGYQVANNTKVDVYSNKNIDDFITIPSGKLLTKQKINTEKLGKQELSFLYENEKGKKKKGILTIEVVDEEEPLIWLSGSYRVKVGSNIDLEEEILCADNYDSHPTCKIEGEYDLNTVGTYQLTYIAKDNSNNEERVPFNLIVYEPPSTTKNNTATVSSEVSGTEFSEVLKTYKTKNTEIGIDVSKWQGDIDFKKVKKAKASFVMIRVGSQQGVNGEYILDPYFKTNMENALKNNLKVGVYFYSYAHNEKEAKKQAAWVLKQIKKYDLSLPIAFDWECYNNFNQMELSLFELNQVAESFLEKVEKAGYEGILYGSKNYLNNIWKYHESNVWLAHYTKQTDYESDYMMWQLCQDGKIEGITTAVDINVLYKNKSTRKINNDKVNNN